MKNTRTWYDYFVIIALIVFLLLFVIVLIKGV